MPRRKKEHPPKEDDMTIGELARIINSAFIKQDKRFVQMLDEKLEQNRQEIMSEIDSREYITKKDLDARGYITEKTLDDRGYATKHDLQDAVVDAKDEIIAHLDQTVTPVLSDHERRLVHLEQKA